MNLEILFRIIHFISIFAVVGALVSEHLLIKPEMTRSEIKRMAKIDTIYGIGILLVIGAGLTLWFGVGKPAEFYTKNFLFHTKLTLIVLLGILSLPPTLFFLRNRKGEEMEQVITVPKYMVMLIRFELLIIVAMPILASLMAKGIGYFG